MHKPKVISDHGFYIIFITDYYGSTCVIDYLKETGTLSVHQVGKDTLTGSLDECRTALTNRGYYIDWDYIAQYIISSLLFTLESTRAHNRVMVAKCYPPRSSKPRALQ